MATTARRDLDGNPIDPMTICTIVAGGFIGSHLCEKLLAVDVYGDNVKHLLEPTAAGGLPWDGRIQFHRLNIKHDSSLEGLIKMADLTINLATICTPAGYNTCPLDAIYSNFIDALPVVRCCSENEKRHSFFDMRKSMARLLAAFFPRTIH